MKNITKIFLLSVVATFTVNCGRAKKPKAQNNPTIEVPPFPQESGLALFPSNKAEKYTGSTIIWHENVTANEIKAIAAASKSTRVARAKEFDYMIKVHQPFIANLEKKRKQALEDTLKLNKQMIQNSAVGWAPEISGIFSKKVKALLDAGTITQPQKEQADTVFELYCESEIWKFASSPTLSLAKYDKRPTPNQLCEGFYSEVVNGKKRYFDGDLCKNESSKNYFSCLWQEGVMRTKYYTLVGDGEINGKKKRDILLDWTKTESSFLARYLVAGSDKLGVQSSILRLYVQDSLDYSDIVAKIGADKVGQYSDVAYAQTLARSNRVQPTGPLLVRTAPADVANVATNKSNPPSSGRFDATWFTKDQLELHKPIAAIFDALSRRNNNDSVSASDYIFNADRIELLTQKQSDETAALYKEASEQVDLKPIFSKGDTSLLASIETKKAEVQSLTAQIDNPPTKAELDRLDIEFLKVQSEGRESVIAPNATKSFWLDSRLEYLSDGDNFDVKFKLTDAGLWLAGTYSVTKNQFLTCPVAEGRRCTDLVVEPTKGHIKMKVLLDNPEAFGFKFKASQNMTTAEKRAGYNDLDPSLVKGRYLVIDFYQNNLYEVMNYFSVTTKFCNESESDCIWEGAMTLTP